MSATGRSRSWTNDQMVTAIKNNRSIAGVIQELGLAGGGGGNYGTVNKFVKLFKLDTSHWTGQAHLRGGSHDWGVKKPLSSYLVKDSRGQRGHIKARLLKEGMIEEKCSICGLSPIWENKRLILVLDHENGDKKDFRLLNLRLLCPNCNSQTDTFTGRNVKSRKRPSDDTRLLREWENLGTRHLAKKYGASLGRVRAWIVRIRKNGSVMATKQTSLPQKQRLVGANPTGATKNY